MRSRWKAASWCWCWIWLVTSWKCGFPPYWSRINLTPVLVRAGAHSSGLRLFLTAGTHHIELIVKSEKSILRLLHLNLEQGRDCVTFCFVKCCKLLNLQQKNYMLTFYSLLFPFICILTARLLSLPSSIFHYAPDERQEDAMDRSPVHHCSFYHLSPYVRQEKKKPTWTCIGYSESTWASNERPSHRGTRAMSQSWCATLQASVDSFSMWQAFGTHHGRRQEGRGRKRNLHYMSLHQVTAQLISYVLQLISGQKTNLIKCSSESSLWKSSH